MKNKYQEYIQRLYGIALAKGIHSGGKILFDVVVDFEKELNKEYNYEKLYGMEIKRDDTLKENEWSLQNDKKTSNN